jgi:hypothetical protein
MSRRWDWGFISRSHCVGVEGVEEVEAVEVVEGAELVEGVEVVEGVEEVEGAEIVEGVEEVEGVEVVFSGEKSLLNSVFSTSTFILFLFSCML